MISRRRWGTAALLLITTGLLTAGCQSEEEVKPAKPAPQAIQQVQSNPNIPPEAKAVITAHMQGKGASLQSPAAK